MKTIWIVGAGVEAVPGIRRAKQLGLHVVAADGNPKATGFDWADDRIVASTYAVGAQIEAAVEYHQKVRPIDGVTSVAVDVPVTVASVANELQLPGISRAAAELSADKLAMKNHFSSSGIPVPWFSPVESFEELEAIVEERGYPLILKPVDSRGARGVLRLSAGVDLSWSYRIARDASPSGRVMVEEFLSGPQASTESILLEGIAATPGFSDRNYEYLDRFAPFVLENGGEQPSVLAQEERLSLVRLAEKAARAMGLRNTTAKGDLVLTPEGPKVIEMAARLSGGWFATHQIPLATGVDMVGIAIRLALGERIEAEEIFPRYNKGVAIRYFFPPPGKVASTRGAANFRKMPWVERLDLFVSEGDVVQPVTDHTRRAGFVITTGKSRQEAVERAVRVVNGVKIETAA
jgi:biotin carboxylase